MRKYIIFSFILFCAQGSFAQEEKVMAGLTKASKSPTYLSSQALRRIRQAMLSNAVGPLIPLTAQATSLPDRPLVTVKMVAVPGLANMKPKALDLPSYLSVSFPNGQEVTRKVFSDHWTRLQTPVSFNVDEDVLYRGMRLNTLDELKHILTEGLEVKKTRYPGIFFTSVLADAVGYSCALHGKMSVVVRVPVSSDMTGTFKRYWANEFLFPQDVSADKISDVVVFMETEGIYNWYKVTLEHGELVFELVPNRIFKKEQLIVRDLKAEWVARIYDLP